MIRLKQLKIVDRRVLADVNRLIPQLSSTARKLPMRQLAKMVEDKNSIFIGVRDGKDMIGMGLIVFILTPVGLRARMEDVVVDEKYRGKGVGKRLTNCLIQIARARKIRWLEFTSRTDRKETNRFYERLGFKKRDTNVYRLTFE